MATTIQISEETKGKLDYYKDYPRESYEDVIKKFIEILTEEQMELSEETKKEIEQARKEFRKGNFITENEMKKRLGLK